LLSLGSSTGSSSPRIGGGIQATLSVPHCHLGHPDSVLLGLGLLAAAAELVLVDFVDPSMPQCVLHCNGLMSLIWPLFTWTVMGVQFNSLAEGEVVQP
jgi:hypothetical protein